MTGCRVRQDIIGRGTTSSMRRKCFECGQRADVTHHVVPKSRGGRRTIPLCAACHAKAHHGRGNMSIRQLTLDGIHRSKGSPNIKQLLDAWPKGFWTVKNIIKAIHASSNDDDETDRFSTLRELIAELPNDNKALALGQALRDSRGRVKNGKRFVQIGGKNGHKWAVEIVSPMS